MGLKELPKPNTQALSWFYGEHQKGSLELNPKYQRNPIWSIGQKCFLIDSLISNCPIPQVFVNIRNEGAGRLKKTIYEIVDGQQRLRAILEFMSDEWALIPTTAKSYPVSAGYQALIGKKYSELPGAFQDAIWNYPLAVQELREWDAQEIRALFRRLNYVVEKLNKQELRHSQFFGEFVDAVEALAEDAFWDDVEFFTRRDSQRMKDVEFVSELFVALIDGVQEGQSTLDKFYADYDVIFPRRAHYVGRFHAVIKALRTLEPFLTGSRFCKKADFYALFSATAESVGSRKTADLSGAIDSLTALEAELSAEPSEMTGTAARYYQTVIEGPNKKAKRQERVQILLGILNP